MYDCNFCHNSFDLDSQTWSIVQPSFDSQVSDQDQEEVLQSCVNEDISLMNKYISLINKYISSMSEDISLMNKYISLINECI